MCAGVVRRARSTFSRFSAMPLTLRQLEAFHTLMGVGSVTRAAMVMGVSQPTVSRLIADMEAETGLQLFDRSSRGLQPTPEALAFDTEVGRAFAGLSHLESVARAMRGSARLSIAATPSVLPEFTDGVLAPFVRGRPDVVLSLDVQTTRRTLEWVLASQVDLGLTFEPVSHPELTATVVGRMHAACLVPKRHRLARSRAPISLAELAGEDFVAFRPDSLFRQQLERLFETAGVAPRVRAEARTTEAAALLASALPALSVIPSGDVPRGSEGLIARRIEPAIRSEIVIVHHASRPLSSVARDFLAFAADKDGADRAPRRRAAP